MPSKANCVGFLASLLLLLAPLALAADEQPGSGSCTQQAQDPAPANSAVTLPDYEAKSDATDPAADAQMAARVAAWVDYQKSVLETLGRSTEPRDWALAASLPFFGDPLGVHGDSPSTAALLQRAAQAAPEDVLVQTLVAKHAYRDAQPAPYAAQALHAVQRLEPDNAAAYFFELSRAVRAKDDAGVDAALAKMSTGHRFDEHSVDILKVAVDGFRRTPLPDAFLALAAAEDGIDTPPEAAAYVAALAATVTLGFGPYDDIVAACRIDPVSGTHMERSRDCATIGRLMAAQADSAIANKIGYAVLRTSHTYTDLDAASARQDDWLVAQQGKTILAGGFAHVAEQIAQNIEDRIASGSEKQALRMQLTRQGLDVEPTADWTDDGFPFSAERLAADEARALRERSLK